jgi:hypothetical protein
MPTCRTIDAFFGYAQEHPFAWRMLFQESTGDAEIIKAHRRIQSEAHMEEQPRWRENSAWSQPMTGENK